MTLRIVDKQTASVETVVSLPYFSAKKATLKAVGEEAQIIAIIFMSFIELGKHLNAKRAKLENRTKR